MSTRWADKCIVLEEIIIHLSWFLKNDQASGDTFNYKVVLFSDFLIIGFCDFSFNSLFEIFSFLIPPPEADYIAQLKSLTMQAKQIFYQNIYRPLKQDHFDKHHILDI